MILHNWEQNSTLPFNCEKLHQMTSLIGISYMSVIVINEQEAVWEILTWGFFITMHLAPAQEISSVQCR